jgi:hypothetical protein
LANTIMDLVVHRVVPWVRMNMSGWCTLYLDHQWDILQTMELFWGL